MLKGNQPFESSSHFDRTGITLHKGSITCTTIHCMLDIQPFRERGFVDLNFIITPRYDIIGKLELLLSRFLSIRRYRVHLSQCQVSSSRREKFLFISSGSFGSTGKN